MSLFNVDSSSTLPSVDKAVSICHTKLSMAEETVTSYCRDKKLFRMFLDKVIFGYCRLGYFLVKLP